ncbi:MAG: hypothetical protein V4556_12330 [Bacteroidota bacterium]
MKKPLLLIFSLFVIINCFSQRISKADEKILIKKEDSLKILCAKVLFDTIPQKRFTADSMFTKTFVRALKINGSFYYPFDSLQTISKLYAPDSSFRIFTWQMVINNNIIRQHGAIQMRTYDGSLKLYPLIDKSDVTINKEDTVGNNKGWIGAVYYKILQKRSSNQNYYTLLGYDEHNVKSSKKLIEVLSFTNDEPVFGGRFFSFEEDTVFKSSKSRFILEFKKDVGARLNYDEELDLIMVDHLISETNEPNKKETYIPDGDYEGFKWKNGKWVHIEKVFNLKTPEGEEPVPQGIRDPGGKVDEKLLKEY